MGKEMSLTLYLALMVLAAVLVSVNLYLAIRAPWKPKDPNQPKPPRSRISSKYLFRLSITVLTVAILVGMAVWCCAYSQFFCVPPTEPVLPESVGPNFSSGIWLLYAAFAGFLGSGFIYYLEDDNDQQDQSGGGKE